MKKEEKVTTAYQSEITVRVADGNIFKIGLDTDGDYSIVDVNSDTSILIGGADVATTIANALLELIENNDD